jgi:hypothetical protein
LEMLLGIHWTEGVWRTRMLCLEHRPRWKGPLCLADLLHPIDVSRPAQWKRSIINGLLGPWQGLNLHPKLFWPSQRKTSISKSLPNQLGIHLFLAKHKKLCSNSLASNLANFSNLANLPPPRAYLRAERERASGFTCKFKRSSSFLSGALRFLTGLFVRLAGLFLFYQVQMANSWRESIFYLPYILASCQITIFAKWILANSWRCSDLLLFFFLARPCACKRNHLSLLCMIKGCLVWGVKV